MSVADNVWTDGPNAIALSAFCISQNYPQPQYHFVELLNGWGCTAMYTSGMSVTNDAETTKVLAKEKAALKALIDLGLETAQASKYISLIVFFCTPHFSEGSIITPVHISVCPTVFIYL